MSTEAVELSRQECTELIAGGGIGRVVFCSDPGPQVYPVTFIVDGGDVVFRTSSYTALGTALQDRSVAFEVDELDHDNRRGWSVIVTGVAERLDDPDEITRLSHSGELEPWVAGVRQMYVKISPRAISGRRIGGAR